MRGETGNSTGTIIAAFLGGAAAGAALALLTAPRSGRDTRQQLTDSVLHRKDGLGRVHEAVWAATDAAKQAMTESLMEAEPTNAKEHVKS